MAIVNKSQGFTLIELLIVLALIAVAAGMSIGLFDLFRKSQLTSQINTLIGSINLARSEAIKRGEPATICRANAALTNCALGTDWEQGWIVFHDVDGNGAVDAVADTVIRVFPALGGENTLNYSANRMTYEPNGRLAFVANGTFTLKNPHLALSKIVIISTSGRARFVNG